MDNLRPPTAIVQQADETERQLIDRAIAAINSESWVIGECASRWTTQYAKGRTDADFGRLIGVDGSTVQKRRQVYETYGDVRDDYQHLSWTHFLYALPWDDAAECLAWADENQASVREMHTWRRMNHQDEPDDPDPFPQRCVTDDEDDDLQADGFESAEHAGDADPYQKPPSTVVSTPKDFDDEPEKPAVPVTPTDELCDELRDILAAFRATMRLLRGESERQAMVTELRRMADELDAA